MPVIIPLRVYQWLKIQGIVKQQPNLVLSQQKYAQLAYDDEIYFRNGYYVGKIMRKHCEPHSSKYNRLLRIRKIAQLMEPQNWAILEPALKEIGCFQLQNIDGNQEKSIKHQNIANIILFLFQKYCPEDLLSLKPPKKNNKKVCLDFNNFHRNLNIQNANNSLQFMTLAISSVFDLDIAQSLGLMINNSQHLKSLMIQGSKKDDYQGVLSLIQLLSEHMSQLQSQICANADLEIKFILEGVSAGLKSQNEMVACKTLSLLGLVRNRKWFMQQGNLKLLQSPWNQCFNFLMQRKRSNLNEIINENLHITVPNRMKLISILFNIVRRLPSSMFFKQITGYISIPYIYERCFQILNPQQAGNHPQSLITKTMQLLTKLICSFPDKIPITSLQLIIQIYKYNQNQMYSSQYLTISLIFQIISSLLDHQSKHIKTFFKIIMNYLQRSHADTRHWIILNIKQLYIKNPFQFPKGCFLLMYSTNFISQSTQFQLFDQICSNQGKKVINKNYLISQQSTQLLKILHYYYTNQLHSRCFITLIRKFLGNNPYQSQIWARQTLFSLVKQMQTISIPFDADHNNIVNPPPPSKNRVMNSIGLKRREMLKYQNYEANVLLLKQISKIKSKKHLENYSQYLKSEAFRLSKEIGIKKTSLIKLYKSLSKAATKISKTIFVSNNMNQIIGDLVEQRKSFLDFESQQSQSLMIHQSELQPVENNGKQSQMYQNQFFKKTGVVNQNNDIFDPDDQNQFISEHTPMGVYVGSLQNDTYLLPFSDQQSNQYPIYICENILEQYEIAYIKILKEKYNNVIQKCYQMYEILKTQCKNSQINQQFIKVLSLQNCIDAESIEPLFMRAKLAENNEKQIISAYLIQIGFHMFSFQKLKRIPVTALQSFFNLLTQNLKRQKVIGSAPQISKIYSNLNIQKQMKFQHSLDHKKYSNKISQTNVICYNILCEIVDKSIHIDIAEPISKITNEFSLQNIQTALINNQQIKKLEQMIEENPIIDERTKKNHSSLENHSKLYNKNTPPVIKNEKYQSHPNSSAINIFNTKGVDSGFLKNKLHQRRQLLQAQLRVKNKKGMKNGKQHSEALQ